MTATTLTRPRALPVAPDAARRRPMRTAALSVITLCVVAGGTWGLTADRGADAHSHGASAVATVELTDGTLRVDGLVDKQVGHVMPGMSMPDDVPVGMRRFAVDVALGATEDEALRYDRRDFTVSGPGVKPVVPVGGQLDRGSLAPGSTIAGSLSFDVPEDATALSLQFRGGEAVALPVLPAVAEEHGAHGGDPAKGSADAPAAKAPAAKAPVVDHHDAPGAPAHDH